VSSTSALAGWATSIGRKKSVNGVADAFEGLYEEDALTFFAVDVDPDAVVDPEA